MICTVAVHSLYVNQLVRTNRRRAVSVKFVLPAREVRQEKQAPPALRGPQVKQAPQARKVPQAKPVPQARKAPQAECSTMRISMH